MVTAVWLAAKPLPLTVTVSPTLPEEEEVEEETNEVIFGVIIKVTGLLVSGTVVATVTAYGPLAYVGTVKAAVKLPVLVEPVEVVATALK
jgi:hypothetical protein